MKGHVDRVSDTRFRHQEVYLATLENQDTLEELREPDRTVPSLVWLARPSHEKREGLGTCAYRVRDSTEIP